MKEIKTKYTIKDIKVLDKTIDVSHRMKKAYIRTKDKAERLGHNKDDNYVDEAESSIQESMETVARKAGYAVGNHGKKTVQKIKERRAPDTNASHSDLPNGEDSRQAPDNEAKESVYQNGVPTETKQAAKRNASPFKTKETGKKSVSQPISEPTAKHNVIQSTAKKTTMKQTSKRKFTLSKPSELAKRRFVQSRAKQQLSQAGEIRTVSQNFSSIQSQQVSKQINSQHSFFQPVKRAASQTFREYGETGRAIKQFAKTGGKNLKKSVKGTIKTTQKSVKTAEHTAKVATKTSKAAAKTAAHTVQTAQRAAQATRMAARAATVSAKVTLKAVMASIKAIIAAAKGLVALITTGGWIAFIIILVICLAGLFTSSVFGIFYSNESSGENTPVMTEVVQQLNEEFTVELDQIQDENPHDTLEMSDSISIIGNWRDILAVYAVKVATDPENGMEVATLDNIKVGILRDVFWDMNIIDYWIETIEHVETVTSTDEGGNETQETVTTTEIILHISLDSKSYTDMIDEYDFNVEQVEMLNELMQDKYRELFMRLIGS
ncbi:hypothetical protein [Petroclostridium sp. X23]|uniref:hypothetical protein n=1 Tax=Petroclostridium sp. X23 TaxID=3045146 RepID=UPI0024AD1B26|nr:hypothetical protein [Petroclostridium sp. X23]WHH59741.1 hypothetical protein QKW49_03000 [Petroclostridium sp. X23]